MVPVSARYRATDPSRISSRYGDPKFKLVSEIFTILQLKIVPEVSRIFTDLAIHPTKLMRPKIVQNKLTHLARATNPKPVLTICL